MAINALATCTAPLWVATYDGPEDMFDPPSLDEPFAMATDRFGNVFVTGHGYYTIDHPDMLTVKYDPQGRELWVRAYSFSDRSYDHGVALTVDDDGNVYVTGDSDSLVTGNDIATVKYDPDGNQLWVARYNYSPFNSSDTPNAIALDPAGNVYVAGYSYSSANNFDAVTIKYDNQGNELWVARFDGALHREDRANALAVDAQGNAYITGMEMVSCFFETNGDERCEFNIVTIKYDTNGNELWVARFEGQQGLNDTGHGIVVDGLGQVYVAGQGTDGSHHLALTLKYSPQGSLLWASRQPSLFWGNTAIAIDALGMVYSCGQFSPLTKFDWFGRKLWERTPGEFLRLDSQGNIYLGASVDMGATGYDFMVTRFDPFGNPLWCGSYNSGSNNLDAVKGLTLDRDGNVILTGAAHEPDQGFNYKTVKFVQPDIPALPVVGIIASDPFAYEGLRSPSRNATFLVWRKGSTNEALTVSHSIGGTAANGVDYQTLPGQVIIPAGKYAARLVVQPIDDRARERAETVRLTLAPTEEYRVGRYREAGALILDNDWGILIQR